MEITQIKREFDSLVERLDMFGKTKCKFYDKKRERCKHPTANWGSMRVSNDTCALVNCPRIIYGHEK